MHDEESKFVLLVLWWWWWWEIGGSYGYSRVEVPLSRFNFHLDQWITFSQWRPPGEWFAASDGNSNSTVAYSLSVPGDVYRSHMYTGFGSRVTILAVIKSAYNFYLIPRFLYYVTFQQTTHSVSFWQSRWTKFWFKFWCKCKEFLSVFNATSGYSTIGF